MSVSSGYLFGRRFNSPTDVNITTTTRDFLIQSLCLNINDGRLHFPSEDEGQVKYIGSPTECALLLFAHRLGLKYEEIPAKFPITYGILCSSCLSCELSWVELS